VYGLDTKILKIQNYLNDKLVWTPMSVYGKLQPTQKNDNTILEGFNGNEYEQIFNNDKVAATIGFLVLERSKYRKVNLDIIFTVDLKQIFSNDVREDEYVIAYAHRALKSCGYITEITEIKEGSANVFSGYEYAQHRDMYPFFVFSFNCNVSYVDNHSMAFYENVFDITTEAGDDITTEAELDITVG